jgi:hypothetical protein
MNRGVGFRMMVRRNGVGVRLFTRKWGRLDGPVPYPLICPLSRDRMRYVTLKADKSIPPLIVRCLCAVEDRYVMAMPGACKSACGFPPAAAALAQIFNRPLKLTENLHRSTQPASYLSAALPSASAIDHLVFAQAHHPHGSNPHSAPNCLVFLPTVFSLGDFPTPARGPCRTINHRAGVRKASQDRVVISLPYSICCLLAIKRVQPSVCLD